MKSHLLVLLLIGCGGSQAPATVGNTNPPAKPEAAPDAPPPGSKVTCHLSCSNQEKHAYGATEEEARANVSRYIATTCKREDGQYFVFCNPIP